MIAMLLETDAAIRDDARAAWRDMLASPHPPTHLPHPPPPAGEVTWKRHRSAACRGHAGVQVACKASMRAGEPYMDMDIFMHMHMHMHMDMHMHM